MKHWLQTLADAIESGAGLTLKWSRRFGQHGLTTVYGLLPDVSKGFTIVALIKIGCSRISGLLWSESSLLAIMGIRAPRANR